MSKIKNSLPDNIDVTVDTFDHTINEHNSMQSDKLDALFAALSKAQGEIAGAKKDSTNPFFKSSYADLASVCDALREPFTKNGLSYIQLTEEDGTVVTMLCHSSGQWIKGRLKIDPVKKDPQGIGSAITYARRYALAAIAGVAQIDDDGEAAMSRKAEEHRFKPGEKDKIISQVKDCLDSGDGHGIKEIFAEYDTQEEKIKVWSLFSSSERAAIKELTKDI